MRVTLFEFNCNHLIGQKNLSVFERVRNSNVRKCKKKSFDGMICDPQQYLRSYQPCDFAPFRNSCKMTSFHFNTSTLAYMPIINGITLDCISLYGERFDFNFPLAFIKLQFCMHCNFTLDMEPTLRIKFRGCSMIIFQQIILF